MLERVIENWLASVNERQYQIPFCQLLAAEGEKVTLTWKPTSGSLDTRFAARPQRWANLMENVKELDVSSVPGLLRENPAFVIFFLLVFPQRFQRTLLKVAEDAIANSS